MTKSIKKTESILKIILAAIVIITVSLVVTMFILDRSLTDRMYDLIILLCGSGALILGIFASVDGRAQKHETERIQREISAAIKELREINKENDSIIRAVRENNHLDRKVIEEVEKNTRLDRKVLEEVEEIEKLEDKEVKVLFDKESPRP